MSDDGRNVSLVLTPEMRERIDRLVEAPQSLIKQVKAELKQNPFREEGESK